MNGDLPETKDRRRENRRVWYLIFMCLALATVAMTSLVLTYRSSENARLAESRANAAEFRSAKNTILNCVQIERITNFEAKHLEVPVEPEPLCDPYEVAQLREYVKLFQWVESIRRPNAEHIK
jgi:hypothetical protein